MHRRPDELIVEEPLEIRLDGQLVTTTMRTPGNDFELAAGLCLTDGLLAGAPGRREGAFAPGPGRAAVENVGSVAGGGAGPGPPSPEGAPPSAPGDCVLAPHPAPRP